MSIKSAQ